MPGTPYPIPLPREISAPEQVPAGGVCDPFARNPFATRYVRPGALEFLFPPTWNVSRLLDRLQRHDGWGQICGPHGTGKSTLLATLIPALEKAGRTVHLVVLRQGQRRWPPQVAPLNTWDRSSQIVVDGFEQLGWLARHRLYRGCQLQKSGLLVTTHHPIKLPVVWSTQTSLPLARQLLERWLTEAERRRVPRDAVETAFIQCQGNLRETWFRLYDLFPTQPAADGGT